MQQVARVTMNPLDAGWSARVERKTIKPVSNASLKPMMRSSAAELVLIVAKELPLDLVGLRNSWRAGST